MARDTLTGSRIRERRVMSGMRQAELARLADVSPSYLNLIEHNKRRIGGKLLLDIAGILQVEPTLLTEGAEAAVLAALKQAASLHEDSRPEADRAEEFAGRFPGWARVIQVLQEQQASLEQTVAALSDRMTHDPQLAEALHDMLGAITGIRSTSSILASNDDLEPEWRTRFSRNISEDAQRLAESSQSLVQFLGSARETSSSAVTAPQDELQAWLEQAEYRFEALEQAGPETYDARIDEILAQARHILESASAQAQARALLGRYSQDAAALSIARLSNGLAQVGLDPGALAQELDLPVAQVMRRLACLEPARVEPYLNMPAPAGLGLAICDASGTLTYRKPVPGFALPRFGAACPLWPLYQALTRFGTPVRASLKTEGRDTALFDSFAIAVPQGRVGFGAPVLAEAHMLLLPASGDLSAALPVGAGCRICAQTACRARREPSILTQGM